MFDVRWIDRGSAQLHRRESSAIDARAPRHDTPRRFVDKNPSISLR